eukprot:gb/GECG01002319.1/.p1 GENE.gb/GECG01002319.1/~~gb/GECG01002319.1/.p1  ORF type:complete len:354 (+),score=24.43 gb/GECG01002319.1/:1-1062(+)
MVDLPMRQIEEDNDSLSDSSSTSSSSSIRKSKSSTSTLKQRFAVEQAPSSSSNDNTTQKGEGKAQEGGDGYYKDHHSHKRERKSRNRILADVFIGLWFALITWATTVKSFFGRILFFTTVFFGVNKAAPPLTRMFWPDFDQIPRKQRDRWINISVSLVHSTISGAYCVWTVWRAWNEYTNPDANWVMSPKSRAPLWTISVSVGYFAYDTWDMLQAGALTGSPDLIVHHAVLLLCLGLGLWFEIGMLYIVLDLLCEINSVFLHLRTLLNIYAKYGPSKRSFKGWKMVVWTMLFISLLLMRLPIHAWLIPKLLSDRDKWPHEGLFWTAFGGMSVINVLNMQLTKQLYQAFSRDKK